jgi:small subunit ribosomal protein S18
MKEKRGLPLKKRTKRKFVNRICKFCENPKEKLDFKDVEMLKKFQTEKGKILQRRFSGNCMAHQKATAEAIKRARELALTY